MEATSFVLFALISISLFVLVYKQFNKAKINPRSKAMTKEDIVEGYEKLILDVIEKNRDDKDALKEKKTQLLKHISKDLHNNIFFDEDEAKDIVRQLASI